MEYKKIKAQSIFDGQQFVQDSVLILKEGEVVDLVAETEAGLGVIEEHGLLCPGFINCHCHLELSHMKGLIPKGTGLTGFLLDVLGKREHNEATIITAIEMAEQEMVENGIVAVGDICNTTYTIGQKQKGNLYYQNFIEATGSHPNWAGDRYALASGTYTEFENTFAKRNSLVPHAPYSISKPLFQLIEQAPGNGIISIHNQEAEAENEFFESGTGSFARFFETLNIDYSHFIPSGTSSLQAVLPFFEKNKKTILVHNVFTSEKDIQLAKAAMPTGSELYWCLCPGANQYISDSMPGVNDFINNNCTIVLGTDSLASNDTLSILDEMKLLKKYFTHLTWATLLNWATHNGALALGIDEFYGQFKKGTTPGVLLISPDFETVKRLH